MINIFQKSNSEIATFWDSTGEWRQSYFDNLKSTPDSELNNPLRIEKEFVIAEDAFLGKLIERATSVLELGCGVGRSILPYIEKHPAKIFVGVDIAPHQIDLFNTEIQKRNAKNASAVLCDVSNLSQIDQKFDLIIICNHTYGNFLGDKRASVLREIRRLLANNGVLMIGGFTNIDVAECCYNAWDVKIINFDRQTGFIELEHYNSYWQAEDSVECELLSAGFHCIKTQYTTIGFIKSFKTNLI